MNQSEFVAIPCNLLKAREKSCAQVAIGFGYPSHWLIKWREIFKPITERSNCNRVIPFDCSYIKGKEGQKRTLLRNFVENHFSVQLASMNCKKHESAE